MTNEELAIAIKAGHSEHVPALWNQVFRFIRLSARKWKQDHPDILPDAEDLTQSGYFALMKAVHYYNPENDYSFLTYLSLTLKTAFAESAGLRTRKQHRAAQVRLVSLDAPLGGEEENDPLIDVIADPDAESYFDQLILSEEQHMIRKVLDDAAERLLSAKQRTVFNELLATDQRITDIAAANQMSVQTVSRIKNDSFWKLRTDTQVQALYREVFGSGETDLQSESICGTGLTSFRNTGLSVVERVAFRQITHQ